MLLGPREPLRVPLVPARPSETKFLLLQLHVFLSPISQATSTTHRHGRHGHGGHGHGRYGHVGHGYGGHGHGGHIQVTNLPSPIWSSFYCFWIPHNHQDFPYLDLGSLHLLLARKGNAD